MQIIEIISTRFCRHALATTVTAHTKSCATDAELNPSRRTSSPTLNAGPRITRLQAAHYSERAMISFMISLVPA